MLEVEEAGQRMDLEQFYQGNEWYAYKYFGAHIVEGGVWFRVYAPKALKVTLIGDFNFWHDEKMECRGRGGIYSLFVPNAKEGQMYKYRIVHHDGSVTDKADPYGFSMELRPCTASIITNLNNYEFEDKKWMECRDKLYNRPFHIYEIHFGSWKTKNGSWYRYEELGEELIPYLKEMGYTHVEIMPLHEHPVDESWGYQCTGFYAPTARYGTPKGLKQFINACHKEGIGVILDFVMVHFAVDNYGLGNFDGSTLYEVPFDDTEKSEWGSYNFALAKGETASFLKSCTNFWIEEYHFDGLRIDAVSNIIYWQGQESRGVNKDAIRFIQSLNDGLHNIHPNAMIIAEDSTSYSKVTAPVRYGGLGFDYKWDLGFMHDTLQFFAMDEEERKRHYQDILFSMHYFYNELFLLAFSHDEVVHGKKTIIDKMYGSYDEKFAQCRALFCYMLSHPGKKLNFMGNEIGQFREWAEYRSQDFEELKQFPMHVKFINFCKELNHIYMESPALYEQDYSREAFSYVVDNCPENLIYAFERSGGQQSILAVFHFGSEHFDRYLIKLSGNHVLRLLIHSDLERFGGETRNYPKEIYVRNGQAVLEIAPYCGMIFAIE